MVSGGVVRFDFATLVHSYEVLVGSGIDENILDWNNREILCKIPLLNIHILVTFEKHIY